MKKVFKKILWILLILAIGGIIAVLQPWQYLLDISALSNNSALTVNSISGKSKVYLDGKQIGETPLSAENLEPGDHKLEIKRISEQDDFYTTISKQIHLESNTRTFVEVDIGPTDQFSSGKTLYYRKNTSGTSSFHINTSPSNATVWIDGVRHGETPLTSDSLPVGMHNLSVESDGYEDCETVIISREGYTLIAEIDLLAKPVDFQIDQQ
ncbi:MAG: PEGA domain-containing protein [Patescibacteria group bacterium]|nr:PEGA domain-containing protein [Patescibacteria group bacterium]